MKLFCREEIGGEGKKKKSRAAAVWTEKEMTTIPLCPSRKYFLKENLNREKILGISF